MQGKHMHCFKRQRFSLDRAARPITGSGIHGGVHLLSQHQQGQEELGLSRNKWQSLGPLKKKKASEVPSSEVKPFQQSTESSRREICPRVHLLTQGTHRSETGLRTVKREDSLRPDLKMRFTQECKFWFSPPFLFFHTTTHRSLPKCLTQDFMPMPVTLHLSVEDNYQHHRKHCVN